VLNCFEFKFTTIVVLIVFLRNFHEIFTSRFCISHNSRHKIFTNLENLFNISFINKVQFIRRISVEFNSFNWIRHGRDATYKPGLHYFLFSRDLKKIAKIWWPNLEEGSGNEREFVAPKPAKNAAAGPSLSRDNRLDINVQSAHVKEVCKSDRLRRSFGQIHPGRKQEEDLR